MKPVPKWFVPLADGLPPIEITIDVGLHPPALHVDFKAERPRITTPMEAAQLGAALQEASREAAARRRR